MMRNKNIALSRSQIESNAWGIDFDGESNIIDVYIRYLRKKVDDDFDVKLIQTIRGIGYMLKSPCLLYTSISSHTPTPLLMESKPEAVPPESMSAQNLLSKTAYMH